MRLPKSMLAAVIDRKIGARRDDIFSDGANPIADGAHQRRWLSTAARSAQALRGLGRRR
jgi:hypothetical protein